MRFRFLFSHLQLILLYVLKEILIITIRDLASRFKTLSFDRPRRFGIIAWLYDVMTYLNYQSTQKGMLDVMEQKKLLSEPILIHKTKDFLDASYRLANFSCRTWHCSKSPAVT